MVEAWSEDEMLVESDAQTPMVQQVLAQPPSGPRSAPFCFAGCRCHALDEESYEGIWFFWPKRREPLFGTEARLRPPGRCPNAVAGRLADHSKLSSLHIFYECRVLCLCDYCHDAPPGGGSRLQFREEVRGAVRGVPR